MTIAPMSDGQPAELARDEVLARLLADLSDRVRHGRPASVEEVAAQHPDLAGELRELWAAAQFAEEFTRPRPAPAALVAAPPTPPEDTLSSRQAADPLPRQFGDYDLLAELGRGGM